ncbi:MAG: Gfo/Idh/MocA family oxidoreductase [Candidatus Marinimicrobia bacterium]|jgi:predicted dehydrogenase|nr:Gfo/Idh/MocA family oxidoreductase [Candidatus Neomarinimicrobiota bacterium]
MYKAVLIGLGNVSWKFGSINGKSLSHLSSFIKNTHVKITAGCTPSQDDNSLFYQQNNIKTYIDFKEMIDKEDPDIVSICSPTEYHFEQIKFCTQNRVKMIWLEKPAVENSNQLNYLINTNSSTKILVNYQRRYITTYQRFKKIIDNCHYGMPILVEVKYSRGLLTNGSHMVDMIFFILSIREYKLLWVENDIETVNPSFILRDKSGFTIIVSGVEAPFHNIDFTVTFKKKRLSILHNDMTLRVENITEHELYPDFYRLTDSNESVFGKGACKQSPFDKALADLINAYENDIDPVSTLATTSKTHRLIDQILTFQR